MHPHNITQLDPNGSKMTAFRKRLIEEDLGVDFLELNTMKSKDEIRNKYFSHPEIEELYKFSDLKWKKTEFSFVYGYESDDEVVSISGQKVYANQFVRTGMHYYTLKKMRPSCRSILWRQGGFIDQTIKQSGLDHFFVTIYPHNKKLKTWTDTLKRRKNFGQMSVDNKDIIGCLDKFKPIGEFIFNNVPQLFIHYSPSFSQLPESFFREIGDVI